MEKLKRLCYKNRIEPTEVNGRFRSASGSLHLTFRRTLKIFNALGLFPISGLDHYNGDRLRFKWLSISTIRFVAFFFGVLLLNFLVLLDIYYNGMQFYQLSIATIVFSCFWTLLQILKITKNWCTVVKRADELLDEVHAFDSNVEQNCFCMTIGLLFLGLSDYIFYVVHSIRATYACNQDLTPIYAFYSKFHTWIYHAIPVNYWFGALYQIIEVHTVFILYFKDIFVVISSLYVSELFSTFNKIALRSKTSSEKKPSWSALQQQYTKLCHLVKLLDEQITSFVFLSHLCNMFYICSELFFMLNTSYSEGMKKCFVGDMADVLLEDKLFHGYALPGMVLRTLATTLLPARVHTYSREVLDDLHFLPAGDYELNTQKFMDQVYFSKVGFTGLGFFYVTRDILLSMLSTIITYEMVLLQFQDKPLDNVDV